MGVTIATITHDNKINWLEVRLLPLMFIQLYGISAMLLAINVSFYCPSTS